MFHFIFRADLATCTPPGSPWSRAAYKIVAGYLIIVFGSLLGRDIWPDFTNFPVETDPTFTGRGALPVDSTPPMLSRLPALVFCVLLLHHRDVEIEVFPGFISLCYQNGPSDEGPWWTRRPCLAPPPCLPMAFSSSSSSVKVTHCHPVWRHGCGSLLA